MIHKKKMLARHQRLANSKRWAARSKSRQLRHKDWKVPDLGEKIKPSDVATFASKNYNIGDSSPNKLKLIAKRLFTGPNLETVEPSQIEEEAEQIRQRLSHMRFKSGETIIGGPASGPPNDASELPANEISTVFELLGSSTWDLADPTLYGDSASTRSSVPQQVVMLTLIRIVKARS